VLLPFIPESMNHFNFVYFCTYLYKANKDGVVPVLLGFKPTPEYVEFNILWIACKATKFCLIREGTRSALPHVSYPLG